jgi:hypothetical protein
MADYEFTFGAIPCLIKTYVHINVGGEQGYIAFPFVVENDGYSLRAVGNRGGQAVNFFAKTEEAVLAQASDDLGNRFGARTPAPESTRPVDSIRDEQYPALMDDRPASLTVLALRTIREGDYVVVTEQGATPLTQTPWALSGALLGRALEGIDAGRRGRVRDVSRRGDLHPEGGSTPHV